MIRSGTINIAHRLATERYAALGVDVDRALKTLAKIPISLHCWQGDDVGGFENFGGDTRRRTWSPPAIIPARRARRTNCGAIWKRRYSLIPGKHRLNLHAFYGEFGGKKVDRDEIAPEHFKHWIAWAKQNRPGPGFQPDLFLASEGGRRLHAGAHGQRHPQLLDRARHPLPRNRRGNRPGAWQDRASPTSGFPTA